MTAGAGTDDRERHQDAEHNWGAKAPTPISVSHQVPTSKLTRLKKVVPRCYTHHPSFARGGRLDLSMVWLAGGPLERAGIHFGGHAVALHGGLVRP
jgi:hypothetical protein